MGGGNQSEEELNPRKIATKKRTPIRIFTTKTNARGSLPLEPKKICVHLYTYMYTCTYTYTCLNVKVDGMERYKRVPVRICPPMYIHPKPPQSSARPEASERRLGARGVRLSRLRILITRDLVVLFLSVSFPPFLFLSFLSFPLPTEGRITAETAKTPRAA